MKKRFWIYPYGYEFFVKSSTEKEIEKLYKGGKAVYDPEKHTLFYIPTMWNPWMCAHECFHIMSDIMSVRGLDWVADMNNEHLAYLLQELHERVWKATEPKKERNATRKTRVRARNTNAR